VCFVILNGVTSGIVECLSKTAVRILNIGIANLTSPLRKERPANKPRSAVCKQVKVTFCVCCSFGYANIYELRKLLFKSG